MPKYDQGAYHIEYFDVEESIMGLKPKNKKPLEGLDAINAEYWAKIQESSELIVDGEVINSDDPRFAEL